MAYVSATVPTARTLPQRLIIALASLGGLAALSGVIGVLPEGFPVPLLVLQHGRPGAATSLAGILRRRAKVPVRAAPDGTSLFEPGVTVLPKGVSATLGTSGLLVGDGAPEAVGVGDLLLATAAQAMGPGLVAVVLTGMLRDGASGVRNVKRYGGRVIVQDPATAAAGSMPSSALATGCVDFVLPLPYIGPALVALTVAPGGGELLAVTPPSWAQL